MKILHRKLSKSENLRFAPQIYKYSIQMPYLLFTANHIM